ncbi:MAG: SDR family NAD(P)-dependent oxidoreductase [Spirochaetales bacterium]|nr:SDR family NAD(P)-dependent oxidoreductase [Spirochaetales bacterium]
MVRRGLSRRQTQVPTRRLPALYQRYGPWALVAGGSEGLGAAFAEALAREGFGLVLAARGAAGLARTAERLRQGFGVEVREVAVDLAARGAARRLERETRELDLGLLVYNAAASHTGGFFTAGLEEYRHLLDVNCRGALELCYILGERLAARARASGAAGSRGRAERRGAIQRRGGILLMSSLAGLQGAPWVTVYGASKAFLVSLAEGLGQELRPRGVDVTVACPGPVLTANYLATKPKPSRTSMLEMAPGVVALAALAALGRRRLVVPGGLPRAVRLLTRLLPRQAAVAMMGSNTARMYQER